MNSACVLVFLMILSSCWGTEVFKSKDSYSLNSESHLQDLLLVTQAIISCLGLGGHSCQRWISRSARSLIFHIPSVDTNTARIRTECANTLMENFHVKCTLNCKIIESINCRLLISKLDVQERDLQDNGYAGIEYTLQDLDDTVADIDNEKQIILQDKGKAPKDTRYSSESRHHPYKRNIYFLCVGMKHYKDIQVTTNDKLSLEREPDNSMDANAIKILINGETLGYVKKEHTPKFNGIDLQGKIPKIINKEKRGAYLMEVAK